jgi:hypothetical protein
MHFLIFQMQLIAMDEDLAMNIMPFKIGSWIQ